MAIYILLVLRLIHVVAGILWGGAAIYYLFFVKPSIKSIGTVGPQFMQNLVERRKMPLFMVSASLLTVLSGIALFSFTPGSVNEAWFSSGPGLGFTLGSITAFIAFLFGTFGIGPISARLGKLGGQIAASGTGPTSEQVARMHVLEKRLNIAELVDFTMLAIAMVTMATARYWTLPTNTAQAASVVSQSAPALQETLGDEQVASLAPALIEFSLETQVKDGRLVFVGIGGEIDSVVNPDLVVRPGDTVRAILINGDNMPHDVSFPDFMVTSGLVGSKGQATEVSFTVGEEQAGTYPYFCTQPGHRQAGQEGRLIVGGQ